MIPLPPNAGEQCYSLIERLYPICRSITGDGVRETLRIVRESIPLEIREVPSGEQAFDWTIPKEWNIRDAYVIGPDGRKAIDFKRNNLHVLNYSRPFRGRISKEELSKHLFTLPEYPDWVPYRTSYHQENWGFCLSHNDFLKLGDGIYEVMIDSTLEDGSLTYGEYYIHGRKPEEMLISCHVCHPSLCNDNLSGISVAVMLARLLSEVKPEYSYRFLFVPATIGAIAWLAANKDKTEAIRYALVLTLLGDGGKFHYKRSARGNSSMDKIVEYALKASGFSYEIRDFSPYGYDERQYCSPGFNLPAGCLMRTPHGEFPEYHTSADNLEFVRPEYLHESCEVATRIVNLVDINKRYVNMNPFCEPQLGKRGLYQQISGESQSSQKERQLSILWALNQSDGSRDLVDIAIRSGMPAESLHWAVKQLEQNELLKEADEIPEKIIHHFRNHL